jgi:hypothetical protein
MEQDRRVLIDQTNDRKVRSNQNGSDLLADRYAENLITVNPSRHIVLSGINSILLLGVQIVSINSPKWYKISQNHTKKKSL